MLSYLEEVISGFDDNEDFPFLLFCVTASQDIFCAGSL